MTGDAEKREICEAFLNLVVNQAEINAHWPQCVCAVAPPTYSEETDEMLTDWAVCVHAFKQNAFPNNPTKKHAAAAQMAKWDVIRQNKTPVQRKILAKTLCADAVAALNEYVQTQKVSDVSAEGE